MTFDLVSFLYLAAATILFFNIREGLKIPFLAIVSLVYIFFLNAYAVGFVLCTAFLAWLGGLLTGYLSKYGHERIAKAFAVLFSVIAVASLVVFKYSPALPVGSTALPLSRLVMPIGYSFYIFQVISYFMDIVDGKATADWNFMEVLLYLCWFPKFVSGPIERKDDFARQMGNVQHIRFLDTARWEKIIGYILVGCFYKLVIADRLGVYVDAIFSRYKEFSTTWLIIGAILYSFQIYCDFAGYSYAAIGISLVFGIELTQNFMIPYCSSNIAEFWRRWHRSLSSWLRDYLYIPLGGNRKGTIRKILNTFIVFIACGLWHGIGSGFLVWGVLHGAFTAIDGILRDRHIQFLREGIPGRILTFLSVTFAWIFFRAADANVAFQYLRTMLTAGLHFHSFSTEFDSIGLDVIEIVIIILLFALLFFAEQSAIRKKCPVPEILHGRHYMLRYFTVFVLLSMLVILGMYGPSYDSSMIYMQF